MEDATREQEDRNVELESTSEWLTVRQAAARCGVTVEAVRDWLTLGVMVNTSCAGRKRIALRGSKPGGRWRIRVGDLETFVGVTTRASLSEHALSTNTLTAAQERRRLEDAKRRVERLSRGY